MRDDYGESCQDRPHRRPPGSCQTDGGQAFRNMDARSLTRDRFEKPGAKLFDAVNLGTNRRGWIVLAFGFVAVAFWLDVLVRNDPISADFHTYLAAAQVGVQHGWSDIYDQGLVAVEQKELSTSLVAQPFLSPPTVAFVTAPLAFLPYGTAYVIWAVILFAAFAAALAGGAVGKGWGRWIRRGGALSPRW